MAEDKIMVMLTDNYPYGAGEAFLETEVEYLQGFAQILIFPWYITHRRMKRQVPANFAVISRKAERKTVGGTQRIMLLRETAELFRQKRLSGQALGLMGEWYQRACEQANLVLEELDRRNVAKTAPITCYSYWMNAGALALIMIRRVYHNARLITRCHRIDLYEERETIRYLPFRQEILKQMDYICPISEDGKKYLLTHYRTDGTKIKVCKLGTRSREILFDKKEIYNRSVLRLVSCSNVIAVKRVYRIVQALQNIRDIQIEWTHFGGGAQLEQIKKMCKDKLGSNISYHLEGQLTNENVLYSYQEKAYHIFLNVSESEGVPVSIMEAMSFGIPVIATNVGGVSEIVKHEKNGYLLKENFRDDELVEFIRRIGGSTEEEYRKMCRYARRFWEKYYNAEKNYPEFVENILKKERENRMKKRTVGLLSMAGGMVAGTAIILGIRQNMGTVQSGKTEKFRMYYQVLNQWLMLRQEGKNLEQYFQKKGYSSIAIYGMGELGNRLLKELENTEVVVKYCMDSKSATLDEHMNVKEDGINADEVDAVVVTAVFAFDEIEEKLRREMKCDIISLEEVVFDV